MANILFFSRDPGGANCIMPLYEHFLKDASQRSVLWGKDSALTCYHRRQLDGEDIVGLLDGAMSIESIKRLLAGHRIDCVVTGTSEDDPTEKVLWKAARFLRIPSVAVLDSWNSYRLRFSEALDTVARADHAALCLPDRICVMDGLALREMVEEGIPGEIICITGQPYLAEVRWRLNSWQGDRRTLRVRVGAGDDDVVVVFVSEAVRSLYGEAGARHWGYDELTLLRSFHEVVSLMPEKRWRIILRPHPKDRPGIFDGVIDELGASSVPVVLDPGSSVEELLFGADLFVGTSSMLLLEAALASRPFLSLQLGQKQKDPFFMSREGMVSRCLSKEDVRSVLTKIIIEKDWKAPDFVFLDGALANIEQVIRNMLQEDYGHTCHSRG